MVAAASGAQAVPNAGSNMLVQLLESQRFEGVSLLADEDKVRPEQDNTDVTEWIVNPDFSDTEHPANGWNGLGDGEVINGIAQKWVENAGWAALWTVSQEVTDLPNGIYKLSAQVRVEWSDRLNLFLQSSFEKQTSLLKGGGTSTSEAVATEWGSNSDANKVETPNVFVYDGKITFGVELFKKDKKFNTCFDNFKLTYVNNGNERAQELYKAKVSELKDATAYPSGLKARVEVAKGEKEITSDNYLENSTLLAAEVDFLNSSAVSDLKSAMDSYTSIAGSLNDGVKQAVEDAIAKANTDIADVTDVENVASITENLTDAFKTAIDGLDVVWVETNFDDGRADGWNGAGTLQDNVMEFFNTNFDFNREFTNLPEGWYQLTLNGFYRNGGADQGATYQTNSYINNWRIYGNDYELPMMCIYEETETSGFITGELGGWDGTYPGGRRSADTNFKNNKYVNTLNIWVSNGTLRVGVRGSGTDGSRWCCLDNVKLTYKGSDLNGIGAAMAAQATANAAKVNEAYVEKIAAAVAHEGDYTVEDVQALNTILKENVEVKNALAQFNIDKVIETSTTQKTELVALSEESENTTAATTAYEQAITKAQTDIAEVVSVEDVNEIRTALADARIDYVFAANPAENQQFDLTFLLTNPSLFAWPTIPDPNIEGWYCDIDKTNFQVQKNADRVGETNPACREFMEVWSGGGLYQKDDNGWVVYQSVALGKGMYKVSAYTFGNQATAWLSAGSGASTLAKGDAVNSENMKMTNVSFYLDEASTAENPTKLGIFIDAANSCGWFGIHDMKLYKVHLQAQDLTLNETDAEYSVTADTYANVTLNRTLKANDTWNSFCVPFDMTAEQLTDNGITEVVALNAATLSEDGTGKLTFENVETIEAGKPYLVKVEREVTSIKVDGVAVHAATPTATEAINGVSMVGNYASMKVPQGAYFINDNQFYYADQADAVNLKGFRAYITVNETSEVNGANVLLIGGLFDDDVTGIDAVANEAVEADKLVNVYTIGGVLVKSQVKKSDALNGLTKGLYIVDGKKVVK